MAYYRKLYLQPATKLGQGYIFTGICDSVQGGACIVAGGMCGCGGCAWLQGGMRGWGGGVWLWWGMHGGGGGHAWWQGGGMCGIRRDMVNEWAVRIQLECILVA